MHKWVIIDPEFLSKTMSCLLGVKKHLACEGNFALKNPEWMFEPLRKRYHTTKRNRPSPYFLFCFFFCRYFAKKELRASSADSESEWIAMCRSLLRLLYDFDLLFEIKYASTNFTSGYLIPAHLPDPPRALENYWELESDWEVRSRNFFQEKERKNKKHFSSRRKKKRRIAKEDLNGRK